MRPEQREAVEKTIKFYESAAKERRVMRTRVSFIRDWKAPSPYAFTCVIMGILINYTWNYEINKDFIFLRRCYEKYVNKIVRVSDGVNCIFYLR